MRQHNGKKNFVIKVWELLKENLERELQNESRQRGKLKRREEEI